MGFKLLKESKVWTAKLSSSCARQKGVFRTILQSLKAGASHYIVKPFMPEALLGALKAAFENPRVQYVPETIHSLQTDNRLEGIVEPLSQEMIHRLLALCKKNNSDGNEAWDTFLVDSSLVKV